MNAATQVTNLALVAPLVQSSRKGMIELLEIAESVSDVGLVALVEVWAKNAIADHPRYPVASTVDLRGKRERIAKLMRLAEMVSDVGLRTLCKVAAKTGTEYPRYPTTTADIVKIPKKTDRRRVTP